MFGKKKDVNQEQSFRRNAEYSVLPEHNKEEIEEKNEPEKMAISARLSSDAEIKGTIKFNGTMRIDGNVNGTISTSNGELVVSKSGIVNATVTTKSAVIDGRVEGKITASDKVVLMERAHFVGELQAKTLVIEEGVVFVGRCNVNPEGMKSDNVVNNNQPKAGHNQKGNFNPHQRRHV